MKLAKSLIVNYYGDNIPEQPSGNPGQDNRRVCLVMAMARLTDALNHHGGDVTMVHLPAIGIRWSIVTKKSSRTENLDITSLS